MNALAFNPRPQSTAIPEWTPQRVRRRISAAASLDGWTAASSLTLAEAICAGPGGLDRAVAATGRSRDDCLTHWNLLFPATYRGGIDNQARLLAALREKVAA